MTYYITFKHIPENLQSKEYGPFEWITLTYNLLRAGTGDADDDIGVLEHFSGMWFDYGALGDEPTTFTDVDIDFR